MNLDRALLFLLALVVAIQQAQIIDLRRELKGFMDKTVDICRALKEAVESNLGALKKVAGL